MKEQAKTKTIANGITTALSIVYLLALYWILLLKLGVRFSYMEDRQVNLIPFNEPSILNSENILNAVIFIPFGIYTGVLFEQLRFGRSVLLFFLFSLTVEGLQYLLRLGAFDVTDILTNTFGAVMGLLLWKAIQKAFNNSLKAQKFINIIAATGTAVTVLFLLLLKLNMLPVKYQ